MENKNLEDIVFDRVRDFLENHSIKIKYVHAKYFGSKCYRLYLNSKVIPSTTWASKHSFLFGDEWHERDIIYREDSIFKISKIFAMIDNNFLRYGESKLAKLWPILRQIQADSLEEMLIKMDLAGI